MESLVGVSRGESRISQKGGGEVHGNCYGMCLGGPILHVQGVGSGNAIFLSLNPCQNGNQKLTSQVRYLVLL